MKKATLLLLCCGLVMCSACNKAESPPTEIESTAASEAILTDENTDTSSAVAAF